MCARWGWRVGTHTRQRHLMVMRPRQAQLMLFAAEHWGLSTLNPWRTPAVGCLNAHAVCNPADLPDATAAAFVVQNVVIVAKQSHHAVEQRPLRPRLIVVVVPVLHPVVQVSLMPLKVLEVLGVHSSRVGHSSRVWQGSILATGRICQDSAQQKQQQHSSLEHNGASGPPHGC